jgi:hypothetical protein
MPRTLTTGVTSVIAFAVVLLSATGTLAGEVQSGPATTHVQAVKQPPPPPHWSNDDQVPKEAVTFEYGGIKVTSGAPTKPNPIKKGHR